MPIAGSADDRTLEVPTAQSTAGAPYPSSLPGAADSGDPIGWREWTRRWTAHAAAQTGPAAQSRAELRLRVLLAQPDGLEFLIALADTVLRTDNDRAAAASVGRLSREIAPGNALDGVRVPFRDYLSLALGAGFSPIIPALGAWFGRAVARRYLVHLVTPFDDSLSKRWGDLLSAGGVRPIAAPVQARAIGNRQADLQLSEVERLIEQPGVTAVALSLAAVARLGTGGLGSAAQEQRIDREVARLSRLARLARATETQLVFEVDQHRDLTLSTSVVLRLLGEPGNESLDAAITLPIDFADSFAFLQQLAPWADDRLRRGGHPLTIRFARADEVDIERAVTEQHRWHSRALADPAVSWGNVQRMLDWVVNPQRLSGLRVIVASEHAHEHALAWRLARTRGVERSVEHEFRHAVSPAVGAAVKRNVGGIRLRCAIVSAHTQGRAADYVVRRLREINELSGSRAIGDAAPVPQAVSTDQGARRITDADPFSVDGRDWFDTVAGRVRTRGATLGVDRQGAPASPTVPERFEGAVAAARVWAERRGETRATVVRSIAESLAHSRTELVAIAMLECGTTAIEADHEVTEAIDLAMSAAESAEAFTRVRNARAEPLRLTLALAPRTSTIAIPAAQLLGALAAGSAVAIKPAPENRRSVAALVNAFVEGGVPDDLIVLVPPVEDDEVQELVDHPLVDRVTLTGSRHTTKRLRQWRPELALFATTGGRNSIIVSESANVERAVADVVASAFHNAGQSPHSVGTVIVVGEHERFVSLLTDAVASLSTGSPLDLATEVGALVRPATPAILESLTTASVGESWLVKPRQLDDEGRLWSPGLVDGVTAGSSRHVNERRAPVLSIMRVESFDEALSLQNAPGFGLTAGLQSLDPGEVAAWLDSAEAGGLAANLPTVCTLPSRHPVAGWNRSSVGLVRAPGGRLQLDTLARWHPTNPEPDESVVLTGVSDAVAALVTAAQPGLTFDEFDWVRAAARDDEEQWRAEFESERELDDGAAELTVARYRALATTVRLSEGAPFAGLVRVLAAATRVHAPVAVSSALPLPDSLIRFFRSNVSPVAEVVIESDARWHARVQAGDIGTRRVRLVGLASSAIALDRVLAAHAGSVAISGAVTASGRVELANFLIEQAVRVRTL